MIFVSFENLVHALLKMCEILLVKFSMISVDVRESELRTENSYMIKELNLISSSLLFFMLLLTVCIVVGSIWISTNSGA